jgi:hypothetical protein
MTEELHDHSVGDDPDRSTWRLPDAFPPIERLVRSASFKQLDQRIALIDRSLHFNAILATQDKNQVLSRKRAILLTEQREKLVKARSKLSLFLSELELPN